MYMWPAFDKKKLFSHNKKSGRLKFNMYFFIYQLIIRFKKTLSKTRKNLIKPNFVDSKSNSHPKEVYI